MRNLIFETITESLNTLVDPSTEEKIVKHIGLWQSSITEVGYVVAFPTPAVFLEFLPSAWKTLCGNRQVCEMQVRLHVVEYGTGQSTDLAKHGFDLAEQIAILLSECQLPNRGKFQRIESLTNHESEMVKDCMETFKITI